MSIAFALLAILFWVGGAVVFQARSRSLAEEMLRSDAQRAQQLLGIGARVVQSGWPFVSPRLFWFVLRGPGDGWSESVHANCRRARSSLFLGLLAVPWLVLYLLTATWKY